MPQEQAVRQPRPVASIGPPSDLADDVTWGADLSERVKPWGISRDRAKECEELGKEWQLPVPAWDRVQQGTYELNSPRGMLRVSRQIGWVATRQKSPLYHTLLGKQLVCDTLEEAQTMAVDYARYRDDDRFKFYFWRTTPTAMSALELARARRALQQAA